MANAPCGSAGLYLHYLCLLCIHCCLWAESQLFFFNPTFISGSIPPLSGFPCGVTVAFSTHFSFLAASAGGGSPGWMNDFLIDVHFCHPSLVSSLKLLPLFHCLSLHFPPSLWEFLHTCLNRDLNCCETRRQVWWGKKKERKQIKRALTGRTVW